MKKFRLMIFILISINAISQTNQTYDLKWKIQRDKPIAYKTAMENIDESNLSENSFNAEDFINAFSDSVDFKFDEFNDLFEAINNFQNDYSTITTLTRNDKGIIDVKLIPVKNDTAINMPDSIADFISKAFSGVQLRGKINENGGIESFYMKKEQMNLLAMMFELPTKPVKIGDIWTIQASFISNDQNFICDDYRMHHEIELIDVKNIEGDTIAFIKYDLQYYVNGEFNNPFYGNATPTMMEMNFNAIAEFNITKGKWKNYDGIMLMRSTGFMNYDTKQRFKLVELDTIPPEMLLLK